MIRLRVLGALGLHTGSGVEVHSLLAQPKRIALLTYLAIASRDGAVRRDTVLALLWPELDTERARHALRQSLYHLRRELGAAVIEGNGDDQLRTNPALLECDAVDFGEAFSARAYAHALELYRGELLPGFHIQGSVEFDQWLDVTRVRLRVEALHAADELRAAAEQSGKKGEAVRWARRAHELAPFDEPTLRRLLEALDLAGDRATAVVAYDAFVERCERELGVSPAPETVAIVERLGTKPTGRRRLRRRVAAEPTAAAGLASGTRRYNRLWWMAIPALLLTAAGFYLARAEPPALNSDLIAITPFRVTGSANDSILYAEGIPDLLAVDFQTTSGPRAVATSLSSHRYWRAVSASRWRRRADARALSHDVAASLGAGLVIYGSALSRGQQIAVVAVLEDVRTGTIRARGKVEGEASQLMTLVAEIGVQLFGGIVGEDPERLQRFTSSSYPAVRAYLEGKAAARNGAYEDASRLLNRALELDSAFAAAALALVDVTGWAGSNFRQGNYEDIAYQHRERLGPDDYLYLMAWMGSRNAPPGSGSAATMRITEDAHAKLPNKTELIYLLGDRFFHLGNWLGYSDAAYRSLNLMERALALDSIAAAREHLVELAVLTGDRRGVRRFRDLMVAKEPDSRRTPYLRWLAAGYLQEHSELLRLRIALDTMNALALSLIRRAAQDYMIEVDDSERAARILLQRAARDEEITDARNQLVGLLRQRGQLAAADSLVAPQDSSNPPVQALLAIINSALTTDAARRSAADAVVELQRRAPLPSFTEAERALRMRASFAIASWMFQQGDSLTLAATLEDLRAQPPFASQALQIEQRCRSAILEALIEQIRTQTVAGPRPALARLDSIGRSGYPHSDLANFVLVDIYSRVGDPARAQAAAGRRLRNLGGVLPWLPRLLLTEARFAAQTGQPAVALAAYRKYLALRAHPDPLLMPQRDSARAEYERLRRRQ